MREKLTVDDVAAATALPSSTIRYYQQQQLIDAPSREGRRAFYGQRHVEQVRRIHELGERGFSLAAIKQMREAEAEGQTLRDLLQSATLADSQRTVEMTLEELADLVLEHDEAPSSDTFVASVQLGIVEPTGTGTVRVHLEALALGQQLLGLGISRDVLLDRQLAVREQTDRIAEVLLAMYRDRQDSADGSAVDDEQFVVLARRVVDFAFLRSLEDVRRRQLAAEGAGPE